MERPTGVTVIAVLDFIGAGFCLLAACGFVLFGGMMAARMAGMPLGMMGGAGMAIVAVIFLGFAVLAVVLGIGLLKLQNWARIVTIIFCGLAILRAVAGLFGAFMGVGPMFMGGFIVRFVITLAINGLILWYLFQPNVKQAFGTTGF